MAFCYSLEQSKLYAVRFLAQFKYPCLFVHIVHWKTCPKVSIHTHEPEYFFAYCSRHITWLSRNSFSLGVCFITPYPENSKYMYKYYIIIFQTFVFVVCIEIIRIYFRSVVSLQILKLVHDVAFNFVIIPLLCLLWMLGQIHIQFYIFQYPIFIVARVYTW